MNEDDLIKNFPRLWHMAEDKSFESIVEHGLLSTSALLDLYEIKCDERRVLERQRRPESVLLKKEGLPSAVVRDQKPMTASALEKCLQDGLTAEEWFEILNARAFFWLSRKRLRRLLGARAYRDRPQTVLTLDTKSLVEAHRGKIELSPLNSGSTIYRPVPRGRGTFLPIAEYPFDAWQKKRSTEDAVVELVVRGGVPDILKYLIAAHRVHGGKNEELWRRPGSAEDEGP